MPALLDQPRVKGDVVVGIPVVVAGDLQKAADQYAGAMVESSDPLPSGRVKYNTRIGRVVATRIVGKRLLVDVRFNPKSSEGSQALWDAENQSRWPAFVLEPNGSRRGKSLTINGNVPEDLFEDLCLGESIDAAAAGPALPEPPDEFARLASRLDRNRLQAAIARNTPARRIAGWARS